MKATSALALACAATALVFGGCSRPSTSIPHDFVNSAGSQNANAPAGTPADNQVRARDELAAGVRAFGRRSYAAALERFDLAVQLDPGSVDARYDRGLAEAEQHAYRHAADDLGIVVKARPGWGSARLHLAADQELSGRYGDAARNFDIALRVNPKSSRVWLGDGVSYYKLHRWSNARRSFAKALVLEPKSGRAHFWLGMTYGHLHDAKQARNELALAAHSRDVVVRMAARKELMGG